MPEPRDGWKLDRQGTDRFRAMMEREARRHPDTMPDWMADTPPTCWEKRGGLAAIVSREPCGGRVTDPARWHISMRGPGRVPTWEELSLGAHALRPGVFFVSMVPPKSWWLNLHPDVLHLWETADAALVEEARVNAQGDQPS